MMNTTVEKLQQVIGNLYVENVLLKEQIGAMEMLIKQYMSSEEKGRVTTEEKEVKLQSPPGD